MWLSSNVSFFTPLHVDHQDTTQALVEIFTLEIGLTSFRSMCDCYPWLVIEKAYSVPTVRIYGFQNFFSLLYAIGRSKGVLV